MHFTIDSDNILTVHETAPAAEPDTITISTEKDLKKATADWPIARLVEVWNGFAGVAPLGDLKPVKEVHRPGYGAEAHLEYHGAAVEHFNEEKQARPAPKAAAAGRRIRCS